MHRQHRRTSIVDSHASFQGSSKLMDLVMCSERPWLPSVGGVVQVRLIIEVRVRLRMGSVLRKVLPGSVCERHFIMRALCLTAVLLPWLLWQAQPIFTLVLPSVRHRHGSTASATDY